MDALNTLLFTSVSIPKSIASSDRHKSHQKLRLDPQSSRVASAIPVLARRLEVPIEEKNKLGEDKAKFRVSQVFADAAVCCVSLGL